MRKLIVFLLFASFTMSHVAAQQALNYQIRSISGQVKGNQVIVEFDVNNSGGAVDSETTARLFSADGTILASRDGSSAGGERARLDCADSSGLRFHARNQPDTLRISRVRSTTAAQSAHPVQQYRFGAGFHSCHIGRHV